MTLALRPSESTAVARLDDPIATQIRAAAPQFAPFLPKGVDVEQVVAGVFLEVKRVPQLAKCKPESIVASAARIVSWGYDIGRTAYLVPFGAECTAVIGYKGMIEMALASGAASTCDAREVYEGDLFEFQYGTEGFLKHVPGGKNDKVRGAITHFYCIWKVRFGYHKWDVMTAAEVETLRQKYSKQWKSGPLEAWYGIKTVVRRSAKQLPQSPKLARFFAAIEAEEIAEFGSPLAVASATATVASDAPSPVEAEAVQESQDTGEDATDAQREFLANMLRSHVWTEDEKTKVLAKAAGATKIGMSEIIDRTNTELKKRKQAEADAAVEAAVEAAAAVARTKATEDLF